MCHVSRLTNDQQIEYEKWPRKWQAQFEYRTDRLQYPLVTEKTRDVFEAISSEMGKSAERIALAVSA